MGRLHDLFRRRRGRLDPTPSAPDDPARPLDPALLAETAEGGPRGQTGAPEPVVNPAPATFAPGMWQSGTRRLGELGPAPSILVMKLDHIGDFITALPAFRRLREAFPTSRISLLCAPFNGDLARSTGLFDAVLVFDYYPPTNHPPERPDEEAIKALRSLEVPAHDIAIDLRHHDDARALLFAIDARVRVGFAGIAAVYPLDICLPEMEAAGRMSGLFPPLGAGVRLSLLVEALVAAYRAEREGYGGPLGSDAPPLEGLAAGYVVLAPGARLTIKQWHGENWITLARAILAATGFDIVLLGRGEEARVCAEIAAALPGERVRDLSDRLPLASVPAVIRGAAALVGLDSAPAHMAATLGRPTVVLFSGLAEIRSWAPVGPATVVLSAHASCAPCLLPALDLCPNAHGCMTSLTPAHVLSALAAASRGATFAGLARGHSLVFAPDPAQ